MWERLIEYLDGWSTAHEVPGGIELTFDHPSGERRTVDIVISPADYEDYLSIVFGDDDPEIAGIKPAVMSMPHGLRYLVYDDYDWFPSSSPAPPPDEWDDLVPAEGGEWVATDQEGKVTNRFSDWPDVED